MTSATDLLGLQEIDLNRDSRRAVIADAEARMGETDELRNAREALREAEEELAGLQRAQRALDSELEDLDARIKAEEEKLYSGAIKNPKELTDLQKEVESLKQRRGSLDERSLASMEQIEQATRAVKEARDTAAASEAEWQAVQGDLLATKTRAESEMAVLDEERARRVEGMDRPALVLYDTLRPKKQGRPVARVERGTCFGCRVMLPTHVVQKIRAGTSLVQCPGCERILVGG